MASLPKNDGSGIGDDDWKDAEKEDLSVLDLDKFNGGLAGTAVHKGAYDYINLEGRRASMVREGRMSVLATLDALEENTSRQKRFKEYGQPPQPTPCGQY